MTHFKSLKSSTGCGQCREGCWEGPTPSGWSGRHQEGSLLTPFCTIWPVSVGFSSQSAHQMFEMGVSGVGRANGTGRVDLTTHQEPPSGQDDPLSSQTLWTGGILMGKMTFQRDECLAKVVCTMELGVLNINPPVRMTPCPPGLLHQTLWMGGILTGKMTFYEDECKTKVVCTLEMGVLNIQSSVRMTPCPPRLHCRLCGRGAS